MLPQRLDRDQHGRSAYADKPEVTVEPPQDPNPVSGFLNVRVKDIDAVYRDWTARGAEFIAQPLNNHGAELRRYPRHPDGYLIEVGQTLTRG